MKPILFFLIIIQLFQSCKQKSDYHKDNDNIDVANYNEGINEMNSGNKIKAIEYFSKVINNTPIYPTSLVTAQSYMYRGACKGDIGDNRGAISDFSEVINKSSILNLKAQAYHIRGVTHLNMGNTEIACSDWSKAGELGSMESYARIKEYCN